MKQLKVLASIYAVFFFLSGCSVGIKEGVDVEPAQIVSPGIYYDDLVPIEKNEADIEQLIFRSLGRMFYFYEITDICGETTERMAQGTCVAISNNYMLSNNHIAGGKPPGEIKIYLSNKQETQTFGATIIKHNQETDLILLKLDKPIPWQVTTLGNEIYFGEKIYFGGYSGGFPLPKIRVGFMPSLNKKYGIYVDPLYYGNSGGGVFNSKGEVIGVIYLMFSINATPTLRGYAIPIDKIKDFLNGGET